MTSRKTMDGVPKGIVAYPHEYGVRRSFWLQTLLDYMVGQT